MMRRLQSFLVTALVMATPGGFVSSTHGEVSVQVTPAGVRSRLLASIIEGSDPFPPRAWLDYRGHLRDVVTLNAEGDAREDGRPSIAVDPTTGGSVVVWSYNNGTDHDIALSKWTDGEGWSPIEFLTAGTEDELDPRLIAAPDGGLHVVWWTPGDGGPDVVYCATLAPGADVWTVPVPVSLVAESARRPDIAKHQGLLRITYERDYIPNQLPGDPTMMQQVVVLTSLSESGFDAPVVVAETARGARLDPMIASHQGKLWLQWRESGTHCAWSKKTAQGWSNPQSQSLTEINWVGVEEALRSIRDHVMRADQGLQETDPVQVP